MMRAVAAVAAVLACACSSLPDEPTGTCGNGVIDPGEDCDGSPGCVQCALTCPTGVCALASYACGVDKLCHAPSGTFHAQQAGSFPFTPLNELVTDIDQDGIGDVVAVTQDTEVVHFGDPSGLLERQVTAIIPSASGLPAFAKLDPDGSQDLVVPTPDGLAAMTSPSHVPLPFPFTNNTVSRAECVSRNGTAEPRGVVPLDDGHMTAVVADRASKQIYVGVFDTQREACTFAAACTLTDPNLPAQIGVTSYDTTSVTGARSALVVLHDHSTQYCVMQVLQTGTTTFAITQVATSAWRPAAMVEQPVLAMVDPAATCPGLVTSGGATGLQVLPGIQTAGGCTLATTPVALAAPLGMWVPSLRAPLRPAIPTLGHDALVLDTFNGAFPQSSIYAFKASGPPVAMYGSNDAFAEIASADVDGDGVDELVAAPGLATDLKILYRTQTGSFLLDRIPTSGTPSHVVLGDYDANGIADIAYIDALSNGEQLMVAYGTRDRPLAPQAVASFASPVFAVLPVEVADSIDPTGQAQDLVVLQNGSANGGMGAGITVLHGSAQRTLFAFFDPRDAATAARTVFSTAVGGNFFPATPETDVLAFQEQDPTKPATAGCPVDLWELTGQGGGALSEPAAPLDVCNSGTSPDVGFPCGTKLCGSTAKLVAYPLADHDVVLGIDNAHHVVTIDPAQATTTMQPIVASAAIPPLAPDLINDRVAVADLDGDGRAELILPYRRQIPLDTAGAITLVCELDDGGVVTQCSDLRDLATSDDPAQPRPLAGLECVDARTGTATPRGRLDALASATVPDLAVSCFGPGGGSVFIVSHASGAYVARKLVDYDAYFLDLADVTGDGVDDLLLLSFETEPTLHVYPQCEARDLACQGLK